MKIISRLFVAWMTFIAVEAVCLIGSTALAKYPLIPLSGVRVQRADVCAEYHGLGFTQYYQLIKDDAFVRGEFCVLGINVAK